MSMADSDYDFDENDDSVDDNEDDVTPEVDDEVVSPEVAAKARDEVLTAESLSPSAKENLRRQLEEEMERFLASGGRIREVPPDPDAV
jgi:hypothetical protein